MVRKPLPEEQHQSVLEDHWETYRAACYGQAVLMPRQLRECRQAFFIGILIGARYHLEPDLVAAIRTLVKLD